MQHLIQQRTRRCIDVQRRDPAPQRQRHKRVTALGDAPPQPPSLATEDDHQAAAVVRRRVVERARRGDRAVAPAAGAPRASTKSARSRARAIRRCSTAGPGAADRGRDLCRAAFADRTPLTPTHSAVRQIAPRFWGSWISSSATISGREREQLSARHIRVAAGKLDADTLMLARATHAFDLLGRRDPRPPSGEPGLAPAPRSRRPHRRWRRVVRATPP